MASSKKVKRNDLTLETKHEVVKFAERNPKLGLRKLAEQFKCGKTQISTILQNKADIVKLYEENVLSKACHTRKRIRESRFADVNETLYEWFCLAVSKRLFPDGPILREKAKEIAEAMGVQNFKASNGWFEKWKTRHNIKKVTVSGESGDVSGATVESWKERLPNILEGYSPENVWNIDESGVFWRTLPVKGFARKAKEAKGGKQAKERLTVAFIVNASGGSESKPIVIWKYENPRCFKRLDKSSLDVNYFSQKKAWMTGKILNSVLSDINAKLRASNRFVLLLMDNAGCHPADLAEKFSNIKVVFLPANTTSVLQPLDLGIIKNFKDHYRSLLLKYVIAKIDEATCASEIAKSLTILYAIRWVAAAWKRVSPETIKKCFRKAGVTNVDFEIVSADNYEEDPFADLEEDQSAGELNFLIRQLTDEENVPDAAEIEKDLPICEEFSDVTWEEEFFARLQSEDEIADITEDDDGLGEVVREPKLKRFKDAVDCLEEVQLFLEGKGCCEEARAASGLLNRVVEIHYQKLSLQTLYLPLFI
ncbi:tigger transposable element-derived protein 6-like [Oscarella lobularis]|uniref:tigger transposable element-derived protein 6-like n=1 Tax=Oscarella lobularis TaxID=121494 RepID=UPI003313B7F3